MKSILFLAACIALLSACSAPTFVMDGEPTKVTSETPDHFDLPARFALARTVYGAQHMASAEELELWTDLAERFQALGHFSTLVDGNAPRRAWDQRQITEAARDQRYNYVLLVAMNPASGTVDITLLHSGSGGVMATARATSPQGGKRGFWGGRITNTNRLAHVTKGLARESMPTIDALLMGVAQRQGP